MSRRAVSLKEQWRQGRATVNGWMLTPSSFSAELMAHAGYDALTIDLQHGIIDYAQMVTMLQAIATSSTLPVVRVTSNDAAEINKVLDAGARAIICPLVNDAEQARAFVRAVKYPPKGIRSFGPARAALYGDADYMAFADSDTTLLAMIETAEALDNLDAIIATEGLDAVYVGPADLSLGLGLGLPTPQPHPRLAEALDRIVAACRARGVFAGAHEIPGYTPAELIAKGYDFVTSGIDLAFILRGAKEAIAAGGRA